MRWVVGWAGARGAPGLAARPVGGRAVWSGRVPLWAVGDWADHEIHTVRDGAARLAVFGSCSVGTAQLQVALIAARAGALRQLTEFSGSYAVVLRVGDTVTALGDLAGLWRWHRVGWAGGTAFATAGLPLADLVGAVPDGGHLAGLLACPTVPEACGEDTPYRDVRRVRPGRALRISSGTPDAMVSVEPPVGRAGTATRPTEPSPEDSVRGLRDALTGAIALRLPTATATATGGSVASDLSGGSASAVVTLLGAAAAIGRLPALTLVAPESARVAAEDELSRAHRLAAHPGVDHVVVDTRPDELPWARPAELLAGPLTDAPSPALLDGARLRRVAAAGGLDQLTGHGARQVLDGHPARLADLLLDRRRRQLIRPLAAVGRSRVGGTSAGPGRPAALLAWRQIRRLAATSRAEGLRAAAAALADPVANGPGAAALAGSRLAWAPTGAALPLLTDEARRATAERLLDAVERPAPGDRPGRWLAADELRSRADRLRPRQQLAQAAGQRLHAPFLDNQVLRAARDVATALRVQPGARQALLGAVLDDAGVPGPGGGWRFGPHLPAGVAAARAGLRGAAAELGDLLGDPLVATAGLVRADALRGALDAFAEGDPAPFAALTEVLAVEAWLRRLRGRDGSCWAPVRGEEPRPALP